jgi:hypothetical protein
MTTGWRVVVVPFMRIGNAPVWSLVSGRVTRGVKSGKCWVTRGDLSGLAKGDVCLTGVNKGGVTGGGKVSFVSIGEGDGVVVTGEDAVDGKFKAFLINGSLAGGLLSGNGVVVGRDGDFAAGRKEYFIIPGLGVTTL